MELFIRSEQDQLIRLGDEEFSLCQGELIHTEYSHKYTVEGFIELAGRAGLTAHRVWTDPREYFAVLHFVVEE